MAGALVALPPAVKLRAAEQVPPPFTDEQKAALAAIADVALPESIGPAARAAVTERFVTWHLNYTMGADMGHGYGASTLRPFSAAPVLPRYAAQFTALDLAAKNQGATSFASASADVRRTVVESALNTPQPVTRMPAKPTGANLVADFMGFYFNSAAAFDQAYNAAIGRDRCRGLDGSDQAPPPLPARRTAGEER